MLHNFLPFFNLLRSQYPDRTHSFLVHILVYKETTWTTLSMIGSHSLTPMTSVSVKLFVLSFCFEGLVWNKPFPMDIIFLCVPSYPGEYHMMHLPMFVLCSCLLRLLSMASLLSPVNTLTVFLISSDLPHSYMTHGCIKMLLLFIYRVSLFSPQTIVCFYVVEQYESFFINFL